MIYMDWDGGPAVATLRQRVRQLLDDELPASYRGPFVDDEAVATTQRFCKRLAEEHLLTPGWPSKYGGADAGVWEHTALREEMWAHDEPRGAQYMGVSWVGPTIMRCGTEEQKARHLPPIAAGDVIWCQGFSEPDAGSDLASLRLQAKPADGDGWMLTGQKIWTSYADLADWCFLAARTSHGERPQDGITIFLVPMEREGISVRPIESLMGRHHLNEVFFDGVRAYQGDVLGEVDRGWTVIDAVLSFERVGIPRYARSERLLQRLWPVLERHERRSELRPAYARALTRCRVARLLSYHVLTMHEAGDVPRVEPAVARIVSTLLDQEVAELAMQIVGEDSLSATEEGPLDGIVENAWRYARSATVAAGTTEIQRLIVARELAKGR